MRPSSFWPVNSSSAGSAKKPGKPLKSGTTGNGWPGAPHKTKTWPTVLSSKQQGFRAFLASIGMPKNFAELGAKEEDIPALVNVLCRGDGRPGSISGFVTLTEEDCEKIYRLML